MSLFYVSPWTHKKHPDTLDCAFLLLWTSCWWRWQFSIPGCSGVVDMSSYCLEKCRLKVDITCVQMRISFSFPTNMCKHELDCFQVTFFSFGTQRIHLRSFLGRISHDTYILWKRTLLPICKVTWQYCAPLWDWEIETLIQRDSHHWGISRKIGTLRWKCSSQRNDRTSLAPCLGQMGFEGAVGR